MNYEFNCFITKASSFFILESIVSWSTIATPFPRLFFYFDLSDPDIPQTIEYGGSNEIGYTRIGDKSSGSGLSQSQLTLSQSQLTLFSPILLAFDLAQVDQ